MIWQFIEFSRVVTYSIGVFTSEDVRLFRYFSICQAFVFNDAKTLFLKHKTLTFLDTFLRPEDLCTGKVLVLLPKFPKSSQQLKSVYFAGG